MLELEKKITSSLKSELPILHIETYEEDVAENFIKYILKTNKDFSSYDFYTWTQIQGVIKKSVVNPVKDEELGSKNFLQACDFISKLKEESIFVFYMQQEILQDYRFMRAIKDLKEMESSKVKIFFVGPELSIPSYLSKIVYTFQLPLPKSNDIKYVLDEAIRISKKSSSIDIKKDKFQVELIEETIDDDDNVDDFEFNKKAIEDYKQKIKQNEELIDNLNNITEEECDKIVKSLLGLTIRESLDAIMLSINYKNKIDLDFISNIKINRIKNTGVLDFIEPKATLDDIGGNEVFKEWISDIKHTFSDKAKEYGIPQAKGHLALGIPGTSKTFSAEALAGELNVPLLKLSTDKIFSSLVGNSEKNIKMAFDVAKQCAPCILLIDEIEKTLSGVGSSNMSDAGTTSRVFATVLENLNDPQGVYTIMTSNDIMQLPPELTRIGRIDALWYFSLPNENERREILSIHLDKNNIELEDDIVNIIIDKTDKFTGAEIEQVVKSIKTKAFSRMMEQNAEKLIYNEEDVIRSIDEINPISEVNKEKIAVLEGLMKGRVRNTSKTEENDDVDIDGLLL